MKKITTFILGTTLAISLMSTNSSEVHASTKTNFKDMKGHWAESAVIQATDKGYIKGYEDNTFRPKSQVTRAEFAAMLDRAIPKEGTQKENFTDVSDSFWGKAGIEKGLSLGFIKPTDYDNNKFEPNKPMTRAELAKWMSNGLDAMNNKYGEVVSTLASSTHTLIPIPEFYKGGVNKKDLPYIGLALGTGLLSGYEDDTFRPNGTTTRAEVAVILMRLVGVMEKQPTSFKGLNELVEVAETGTNLTTVSGFKYISANDSFKVVVDKPITYKNKIGVERVKRLITIQANDPSDAKSSIFGKMFIGNDSFLPKNKLQVFLEREFTSNISKMDVVQFAQGTTQALFTPLGISSESKIKSYGFNCLSREEWSTNFKKGQPRRFWTQTSTSNEYDETITLRTDDSFFMGINRTK